jgi:putative Mn2+ efflux pump MntP
LALDAFAVSIAGGAYFGKSSSRQKFRLSFHFGLFQFMMPIIGWFAGARFVSITKDYDHWIAFIILLAIGIKMIMDSLKGDDEIISKDISKGINLVSLAFATSIDALAVGFSFGIMNHDIFFASVIIGITAALMSLIGIKIGEVMSVKYGNKVGLAGGIILIILGLNILYEHLKSWL